MLLPLSWLKDYIDIDLSLEELARTVDHGRVWKWMRFMWLVYRCLKSETHEFKFTGLAWDREKFGRRSN